MTAIVAIKKGKQIAMGADGVSSTDKNIYSIDVSSSYKVQRILGTKHCLIAGTGEVGSINIVRSCDNLLDGKEDVSFDYMVNKVVPKMFHLIKDANKIGKDNSYVDMNAEFVIATKTHLYKVNYIGNVTEYDDVCCAGSGNTLLFCKYNHIKDKDMSLEEKIIDCLNYTIAHGKGYGYPLVILNNYDDKEIIIKSKK